MASPRFCCAAAPTEGSREAAAEVEDTTRVDRPVTALVEGACRESILSVGCAQLSFGVVVDGVEVRSRYCRRSRNRKACDLIGWRDPKLQQREKLQI